MNIIKNNMAKIKIIGTGLTGLVGSRIVELLKEDYDFENISRSTGIDITKREEVIKKIQESKASIVLHLAAKTDVDGCEKDKIYGKMGEAWTINVLGTKNIVEACERNEKKLIYVSTDFVFDGEKNNYNEEDNPNPINWYGKTKYDGELLVQKLRPGWIILRLAYPYRSYFSKTDFARTILKRLKEKQTVQAISDHIFTPTFIDDIAFTIDNIIKKDVHGIFHVVGDQFLTPYEASFLVAKTFGLNASLISKTTREIYFNNRAQRPFCLALKNDRIKKLDFKMRTFEEGIKELKAQMLNSKF